MKNISTLFLLSISALNAQAIYNPPAGQQVVNTLAEFTNAIKAKIGNKPFAVYEYLGFSGAGYANISTLKNHLKQRALAAERETKKNFGANAITVFLLGGTTDGFGAGYEVLADLRTRRMLKDAIVGGLVSSDAVKYHLEGQEKGWGDVISPHQDVLLLLDTYKAEGQSENWELISHAGGPSTTVQVLLDLAIQHHASQITMELFEGGLQAIKEGVEYLFAAKNNPKAHLVLHVGYEPKKPAKAKGYRAATSIAQLLKDKSKRHGITLAYTFVGDPARFTAQFYYTHPAAKKALERPDAQEKMNTAREWYDEFMKRYGLAKHAHLSRRTWHHHY